MIGPTSRYYVVHVTSTKRREIDEKLNYKQARTTPILHVGYLPVRARDSESLALSHSASLDILRLGPGLRITNVREAQAFSQRRPISGQSQGRSIILRIEGASPTVQNALLRLLEEPPPHTLFILTAQSLAGLLPTIVSRCQVYEHTSTSYGASIRELTQSGMTVQRAAYIASQLSRGYPVEETPTEHDHSVAKTLIEASENNDIEMGMRVTQTFQRTTMTALRERLLEAGKVQALSRSYTGQSPQDNAVLVLQALIGARR